jgi:hypothetical protein
VLAGELAGGRVLSGQQRTQTGEHALHVVVGERLDQHLVDVLEQVVDVGTAGGRVVLREVPVGVGGADDPVAPPRDDEQHRLFGAQDQAGLAADAVSRNHEVDALGRPHVELPALAGQALRLVGPDAGRVDDLTRCDVDLLAGLEVLDAGAGDPVALPEQGDDASAAGDVGTVGGCRARQEHRVTSVVDLAVVVVQGADEGVLPERRHQAARAAAAEVTVVRHTA